jgi:hypothetical protein
MCESKCSCIILTKNCTKPKCTLTIRHIDGGHSEWMKSSAGSSPLPSTYKKNALVSFCLCISFVDIEAGLINPLSKKLFLLDFIRLDPNLNKINSKDGIINASSIKVSWFNPQP